MSFKKTKKGNFAAPLIAIILGLVACSDEPIPAEYGNARAQLTDTWDSGCRENPRQETAPDSPVGYFRETLEIYNFTATQTVDYYQDANCTEAVTRDQVTNTDNDFFLRKQSQQMSVHYPLDKTTTELGEAYHINLNAVSVSIDDVVQNDEDLLQKGIELEDLLGIFVITDSDQLHLGTSTENPRATEVPLDFYYIRATN